MTLLRVTTKAFAASLVCLCCSAPLWATESGDPSQVTGEARAPLSPRNANYTITVRLDPETKMLEGRQVVLWRNIQDQAAAELRFHLYWNAWRNRESTWLREDRHRGRSDRGDEIATGDWSYMEVESIRWLAPEGSSEPDVDLGSTLAYVSPDDGNPADRTAFKVDLPMPVGPGESVEVEVSWRAKIPRTFARTGFRGNYFFLAHWFPKLGVFENGAWTTNQFHSATEFYSDYGIYDVAMTVPRGWVLGATGRLVDKSSNPDGTETHRHVQEDVHAFTWTTSSGYVELRDRFTHPDLPPVEIRLLMQPEHLKQAERHFTATKEALKHYGTWYGPYPYGHVTVVDPAYGSGAGGMEYPTLFTAGTRLFNPFGSGRPEGVTIHEAGHQFWYGIVGNNEFDHAWLDEGLNSFSDARVYDESFGKARYTKRYFVPQGMRARDGFFPVRFDDVALSRELDGNGYARYRSSAVTDTQVRPTWRYHPQTAAGISYSRSAIWLHTLERYLGWPNLQNILSTFFDRWKFRHPTGEDFFAVASEAGGEDLNWFFDEVVRSARTFDYAIDSVESWELESEGYFERDDELEFVSVEDAEEEIDTDEATRPSDYRSSVVVRRLGSGRFPVEVEIEFEDGTLTTRNWDGRYRWKEFIFEGPSKVLRATVDPERILLLDTNYTNNTRTRKAQDRWPAVKWAGRWLVWLQDFAHTMAFFA